MTIRALRLSPVVPLVHDHNTFIRRRSNSITSPFHPVADSTRTLASSNNWNIEISRGLLPQTCLADVADLLASAFQDGGGDDDDIDEQEEESSNPIKRAEDAAYKLRLIAALQFRGLTEGRQFITVLARSTANPNINKISGVVTLAPGLGPADAEGHLEEKLPEGQTIASISNMAVEENSRRQGLGKLLLETVESAAGSWPVPPSLFALCVYRTNDAALELYRNSGYVIDESWTDPKWLHAAERGLASGSRRYLMIKKVAAWETESEDER